ncbi:unnamed protein product [Clonostachys rosea]|uniref:alcohol dehydrogenase n=1 Tax=Bionectria ochroleuca TaxID=29856 RepID=A0ABY6UPA1_BIOOC|nr:unnamed protein product [Clonostachys rosea]
MTSVLGMLQEKNAGPVRLFEPRAINRPGTTTVFEEYPVIEADASQISQYDSSETEVEEFVHIEVMEDANGDEKFPAQRAVDDNTLDDEPKWFTLSNMTLPKTQNAIVTPVVGQTLNQVQQTIPVQLPQQGEVVVKMIWTGICGSDVLFSVGPQPGYCGIDHIAGHEGIGRIVMSTDPSLLGSPVAARYLAAYCRSCQACRDGLPESCPMQTNFPKHHNGTFQEYLTVSIESLMKLPQWIFDGSSTVSPGQYTAGLCSGAAAGRALKKINPRHGDVVVITGVAGGIGHIAGMLARNVYGAKVIGVDWGWKYNALGPMAAKIFDAFVPAPEEGVSWASFQAKIEEECTKLRGPAVSSRKADGLVIAVSTKVGYQNIGDYVRDGGSIVCVGVPKEKINVSMPLSDLVERALRIQGVLMGGWEESYEVLEYIRRGMITPIVTNISLQEVPSRMKAFAHHGNLGKIVVQIQDVL